MSPQRQSCNTATGRYFVKKKSFLYVYFIFSVENFVQHWKQINQAMEAFVPVYENLHRTTVLKNSFVLETIGHPTIGTSAIFGTINLKFMLIKDDVSYQSAVLMKVPRLGASFAIGEVLSLHLKDRIMYEVVLPMLQQSLTRELTMSPHLYITTESGLMVLENPLEFGFYTTKNLLHDFPHCLKVLTTLAQFHALSVTYEEEASNFYLEVTTEKNRAYILCRNKTTLLLMSKFKKHVIPILPEAMKKIVQDMLDDRNINAKIDSVFLPASDAFNVIIQGDPSTRNVFFKNNRAPHANICKFVNFRASRRASPAIDLVNYLMMSVEFDVYRFHVDTLFQYYLGELKRFLKSLGNSTSEGNRYTINQLKADVHRYRYYFLFRLISNAPLYWLNFRTEPSNAYDVLFQSRKFKLVFGKWMDVLFR